MLLSDDETARFIRRNFVPCWQSVRPAPKVTIDFGDGTVMRRTLRGNTVFLVCLPDGRPVDALPGVYVPAQFRQECEKSLALARSIPADAAPQQVDRMVRGWHEARHQELRAARIRNVRMMASKAAVESPVARAVDLPAPPRPLVAPTLPPVEESRAQFEAASAQLIDVSEQPATVESLRARYQDRPGTRKPTPEELGEMAVNMDSQTNVDLVRPVVHLLFRTYERLPDVTQCRDDVYKRILHVPIDDPYLGLADALVPGTPTE